MKFENIYRETEENLRLALLSLWAPGSHPMRHAIEELFDREPLLAEPVFQSTFGWESVQDETWRNYLHEDIIGRLVEHTPYKHQAESWRALNEGRSIVVTSGTGSGKTECFMYPVLDDLRAQGKTNAIEAIFLYPLNALMEDQKKRLNKYCRATGLHFAVYNGDTPEFVSDNNQNPRNGEIREQQEAGENGGILSNEITSRQAIRNAQTRPEILLTNPSMLEYILVRQNDQQMLRESAGMLRWIVIDEAHTYSGSAAVELAYQIKRILEAFNTTPDQVRFACTSATIGGEEGTQSLIEFISTITGQPTDRIQVIGGNRLVPPLDEEQLAAELRNRNLPPVDKVLSLRNKINEVSGMTIQQIWEWLYPERAYNKDSILPALRILDQLCEMRQGDVPVLSLRAHYFMRSINGLYACANSNCDEANTAMPIYGHLTTYKSSICKCGAPLLELVQCKRCGGFVLMGCSDNHNQIFPCEDDVRWVDYFSVDRSQDEEEDDEQENNGTPDTFFLMPYERERFFNPVRNANVSTINIDHSQKGSLLHVQADNGGQWVEVRRDAGRSYCPSCGKLAQGTRLNFKHFQIPISFINQAISPVLLHECAPDGQAWGKYIAFTDSRQGTAISAKTFNIDVERTQSRQKILQRLAKGLTEEQRDIIKQNPQLIEQFFQLYGRPDELSLSDISGCIFDESIFNHITNNEGDQNAYKAALMRQLIGRKSLFENSFENMGLITLVYPGLRNIHIPNSITDYNERYHVNIEDQDWRNFLKISLDYFFRVGNHIQQTIPGERNFLRDGSLGESVAADSWPSVRDGRATQNRLILLLCAGLGINTPESLTERQDRVIAIMRDAWNALVDNHLITRDTANDGRYYLDLSATSIVCRIKSAEIVQVCPVTGNLIDTTFCGYSPYITGEVDARLFERYRCTETIHMPIRPQYDEDVDQWVENNEEIRGLKERGLWSDRHKYSYKTLPPYIAAEHSAQQSKNRLREYTEAFRNNNVNVLHCSTTMEMGVDIGDIEVVLMDTVPPTAANYLQRVGRAGRMGQSKAVAFSLCNNTPVGQNAFANPMWALQTTNHMIKVRPSRTIIQRHINSFFFRQFICGVDEGIQVTTSVSEFMDTTCDDFVNYLDDNSTNDELNARFHAVFGDDTPYDTILITIRKITDIRQEYRNVIDELRAAYHRYENDARRRIAISNQIRKCEDENLLNYLSEHQFIPNANMPTGVVSFDFISQSESDSLNGLYEELNRLRGEGNIETNEARIRLVLKK